VLPSISQIISKPKAIWVDKRNIWKSQYDESVIENIRESINNPKEIISEKNLNILNYRPDLFKRIGPVALKNSKLNFFIRTNPDSCLVLLKHFYTDTAPQLEETLASSGKSIHELLAWASVNHRELKKNESFYRDSLVVDSYWGYQLAKETHNTDLLKELNQWCSDERFERASAATIYLELNPKESPLPYRDLIIQNSFYAFLSQARFNSVGAPIQAHELYPSPNWAAHFALSPHCKDPASFTKIASKDTAWLIEIAYTKNLFKDNNFKEKFIAEERSKPNHPHIPEVINSFLDNLESPNKIITKKPIVLPGMLDVFTQGKAAEQKILKLLQLDKNKELWRPSEEQIESNKFKEIVGAIKFTKRGLYKGTVLDSTECGYTEIKSGKSPLRASYQLRLQTYKSVIDKRPFTIYTDRPTNKEFIRWSSLYEIKIKPIPTPSLDLY
jgi:hypothetical protein